VHEQNKKLIALAAGIVGLDVAGVDISTVDISRPLTETGGAIIEINAAPGIRMHHYPYKGTPRNVAKAIVDMLFPEGSKSRIPIVSVTGTNGKNYDFENDSSYNKSMGHTVGMTTTSGIYIMMTDKIRG
jgi:cyanophycin synthetase